MTLPFDSWFIDGWTIRNRIGEAICVMGGVRDDAPAQWLIEQKQNIKIIAASADLFSACEALAELVDAKATSPESKQKYKAALRMAVAAVAKAKEG